MKLSSRKKYSPWDTWGYYTGRHRYVHVQISELDSRGTHGAGFYVMLDAQKLLKKGEKAPFKYYNSLRFGKKFDTLEEAGAFAVKWIDDKLGAK